MLQGHFDFLQLMVNAELDEESSQEQHINSGQKSLFFSSIRQLEYPFFLSEEMLNVLKLATMNNYVFQS